MCFSSKPSEDTYVQDMQAAQLNWMQSDWAARFKPLEQSLINEQMNRDSTIRTNVADAGASAEKSYAATQGMAERNMTRYGTELDADQQAAMKRSEAIASQGTVIGARNLARQGSVSRQEGLQKNMVSLGRGVKTQAMQGLNQAGDMEAQRNAGNQSLYAQNEAAGWQAVGTAASIAAMVMMSDKKAKKNVRRASAKKALKDVNDVDLKHFDYKPGMSGGRTEKSHIGGMAQDMPRSMTTPDRKGVDLGDSVMNLVGATQALSKKVDKLEKKNGRH